MPLPIYEVFTNPKLLNEHPSEEELLLNPMTGQIPGNVMWVSKDDRPRRYVSKEFIEGATYKCEHHYEYALDVACWGRDWNYELEEFIGFVRSECDSYTPDSPFFELRHPDYSMTTFGPLASAKLVADFKAWDERARRFSDMEFYIGYLMVWACFERAANNNGAARCFYRFS